jgi:hypothetical protein
MSNFENDRYTVGRRRGRALGLLMGIVVVVLVVVGVLFATGRWGQSATRTGAGADTAPVPPAAGPSQPGVPTTDNPKR